MMCGLKDTHNRMLQTIISHYVNGTLYCKLAQSIIPVENIKEYLVRPLDVDYFILMSSGPTDGEGRKITYSARRNACL